jgi:ankyrin repeat protein
MAAVLDPSALWTAAEGGRVTGVRQLLSGGANIEERGRNGFYSPLHIAVYMGRAEVVQVLLERGADVLVETSGGDALLHLAFILPWMAGCEAIIRSLLLKGADVSARNNDRRTNACAAIPHEDDRMDAQLSEDRQSTAWFGVLNLFKRLIPRGRT